MVDRIRHLLQTRQLSPTQFADTIGVARPIVSHILGGRNKPSLEVVQKIIVAFPDVSMPWLLTGQGPMLAAEVAPASPTIPSERANDLVAPPAAAVQARRPPKAEKANSAGETRRKETTVTPDTGLDASPVPALPAVQPPITPAAEDAAGAAVLAAALTVPPAKPAKTIRRVLIFYSDGTFTDFSPASESL